MPIFAANLFAVNTPNHSFLFNQSEFKSEFKSNQNLILPIAHDSEWNNSAMDMYLLNNTIPNRLHISTQVKHIFEKPFCFFTDDAIKLTGNSDLLPMQSDNIISDYLKQFGIDSYIEINESNEKIPNLDLYLYSFFGIVDIPLLAKPDTILYNSIEKGLSTKAITHNKRLNTNWNKPFSTKIIFNIKDNNDVFHSYNLRLLFIDIGAIHGNASYEKVCQNVGIDTSKKSLMDNYKSDMLTGLKLHPDDFIEYANNDLNVYDALVAYDSMLKNVYRELDLDDYYLLPKLTIGSTVVDIISAAVFKWQNIDSKEYHAKEGKNFKRKQLLTEMFELSSASYLRTQLNKSKLYLLGKVHGGRCHNNNPTVYHVKGVIVDNDYTGAYSGMMTLLPLFKGEPWFYDGAKESIKLREFLKRYEKDFDEWHYVFYVSTNNELLDYEQDFLVSWSNLKSEKVKYDGELIKTPIAKYDSGYCKVFKREIDNCPITSDSIKWIRSLSKKVKDDLLDKLIVEAAIGYKRIDKDIKWQSINLGILLINKLKEKRAYYKNEYKNTGNNTYNTMQELYKLIINTIYGDQCSRHFVTSNVVVANQITQGVRLAVYLMEKGLNLQGAITDGCMGDLNKVVYPLNNRKVKLDKLVNLYKYNSDVLGGNYKIRLGSLDNAKHIDLSWENTKKQDEKGKDIFLAILTITYHDNHNVIIKDELKYDGKQYRRIYKCGNWIDNKSWQHLRDLFPNFHYLLDYLKIESKDIYDSYIYHGAANYRLINPNNSDNPKCSMRGYRGKRDIAIGIEYDNEKKSLIATSYYKNKSIPEVFLSQLEYGKVKQNEPFIMEKILKSKEYVERDYFNRSNLICGDNIIQVGLPNYCSLSQYTFQTINQYEKWQNSYTRLKNNYGESFEIFFTDKNDILDYDLMIRTLCEMIDSGIDNPIPYLRKIRYARKNKINNRYLTKLKASELRNILTFTDDAETENDNDFDYCYLKDE